MKKQQLVEKLELAWAEFTQSYAGLNEAQLLEAGVAEGWSVKDILAHVTTWEQEALKYLPLILQGIRPPRYKDLYGGIDAFNAQMTERNRSLSLAETLERLDQTHQELVAYLRSAPDDQFTRETPFRRRLRLDTYSHYPIHTQNIRDWRQRTG